MILINRRKTLTDVDMDNIDWVNSVRSGEYSKWIEINYKGREKLVE